MSFNEYILEFLSSTRKNVDLSPCPYITMKFVLEHPEMNWNWDFLSLNPSITMKDVLEHPDKNWNWNCLSVIQVSQ